LDSNIEGLKNEHEFELEIRSSQIQTSFKNPIFTYFPPVDKKDNYVTKFK